MWPGVAAHCALAAALASCLPMASAQQSAASAPASAPSTAPATAPEPLVDNPHYLAWANHRPGTTVEFDMAMTSSGQQVTTHITLTLLERTAERAAVESAPRMSVLGVPDAPQPQKQTLFFDAKAPQSAAERATLPLGAEGQTKEAGTETVDSGGQRYECNVTEFIGKANGVETRVKQWRSPSVPGGLVKLESTSGGPGLKVAMQLTKVTVK